MDGDYNWTGDVSLKHVCDRMSYCTHHSDKDVPHYANVYVPSSNWCYWMFYYNHHSDMDVPQYVLADVSSGHLFD
jgi:hypothetical protein